MARTLLFTGSVNQPLSYAGKPEGRGIASFFVDEVTGATEAGPVFTGIVNPTFVAISPDGRRLAAISETEASAADSVTLFEINRESGELAKLGMQSTNGSVACHCAFDASGTMLATANYTSDIKGPGEAVSVHRIEPEFGPSLSRIVHRGSGPNQQRQEHSHAHCVRWTPDGQFIAVVDLGIDAVRLYRADDFTLASEAQLPPGSGPRHLAFHPVLPIAYVMSELETGVSTFRYENGGLDLLETEPVQPPVLGGSGIVVAASGTHLFVGDRGNAAIARFGIGDDGIASYVVSTPAGGDMPRDLALSPSGALLAVANVMSDTVTLFRHAENGDLAPLSSIATGTPTAVAFA